MYHRLVPLAPKQHGSLRLAAQSDVGYLRTVTEVPVHGFELRVLTGALPLAIRWGPAGPGLVGLTGLRPGENLFVGPQRQWTAIATPDCISAYPFAVKPNSEGQGVLCADMGGDLLLEDGDGEALFDAEGEPTATLAWYRQRAVAQFRDRAAMARMIQALEEAGVLAAWEAADIPTIDPDVHYYVQPKALDRLSEEQQIELMRQGALALAHAQIHSMVNMRRLRSMARRQSAPAKATGVEGLLASDGDDDLALDFSNL